MTVVVEPVGVGVGVGVGAVGGVVVTGDEEDEPHEAARIDVRASTTR